MPKTPLILAIDQGTTSSRAIVFDRNGTQVAVAQREFRQHFPGDGEVEHDPEEIWETVLEVCREAVARAETGEGAGRVVAIGITNQRETTLIWNRKTGKPVYRAIVWQDRRTAGYCNDLKTAGHEAIFRDRTGLLLDPYFSGTKVRWILDNVPGTRSAAEKGELAFGTVDSFLLWRLTGGKVHATDATNASRTLMFNIHENGWDDDLLDVLQVPRSLLPDVRDSAADFGVTDPALFGGREIPICGIAGDQQAATVGQACFSEGDIKSTYGTGCFVILNTGTRAVPSANRLLTTVAWRLNGVTTYALEGSIFVSGAAVQWLRDNLGIIESAPDTEHMAAGLDHNSGVYMVPGFTGLGAPHWDPDARGAIFGLTRDTGPDELARATLESVCYQTRDLFRAMADDGVHPSALRVDGGMVANSWLMNFLADILDMPVDRPGVTETTALGAAYLAGLRYGLYDSLDDIREHWNLEARFEPTMATDQRLQLLTAWDKAVACARAFSA